jgi:hypothetical protein
VTISLQILLLVGLALEIWQAQWLNAAATVGVLVLTLLPVVLGRAYNIFIPPELEALAELFVFAALFLGLGALWEILEFAMERSVPRHAKSGLVDTM